MDKARRKIIILLSVLGVIVIAASVSVFFARVERKFMIDTVAMSPTLQQGDIVSQTRFDPSNDDLQRFEIIVFRTPPVVPSGVWVMRVIGLPGEQLKISTNSFEINGSNVEEGSMPATLRGKQWLPTRPIRQQQWLLGPDEVFVVGDNLSFSNDSRFWGPLHISNVFGVVNEKAKGKRIQIDLNPVLPVRKAVDIQNGPSKPIDLISTNVP